MIVNGESIHLQEPCTIAKFLNEHSYRQDRIAIELNGQILSKEHYDKRTLSDSDQLEIVQFIGGG